MYSFEVPKNKRLVQVVCAILWCLLSGGPIFGFAALKPILVNQHVYEYLCDATNSTAVAMSNPAPSTLFTSLVSFVATEEDNSTVAKCTAQDLKLNMMFTVGAVLTNVSALAIGRLLDVYGPKFCGLVGAFFLYLASLVFIYSTHLEAYLDPYLIGYASLALGGPFAYISSFQLSNAFPENSGTILALLTGAFDASSAVFLGYKVFYNKFEGNFSLKSFFTIYLIVPVFMTLAQIFIMPTDGYKTSPDTVLCADDHPPTSSSDETSPLLDVPPTPRRRDSIGDALKQPYAQEGEETLIKSSGGIFGILHGYSAEYQFRTPWFSLMCLFSIIQMLRLNYFVATIQTQYTYLLGSVEMADQLNKFFDIALPLGGVLSVPFIGLFLDNCSTVLVLSVLLLISVTIGFLGLVHHVSTGYLNVLLFVAYRPFFYTSVSDFCAKVFGFDTFGTVYGAIMCISGVVNYFQSFLDLATHTTFNMNPTPINVLLVLSTIVIGVSTVAYVQTQARIYNEKRRSGAV